MSSPREQAVQRIARDLGHDFSGPIRIGGNYTPVVAHAGVAHVSGQVPRVGDVLVSTGRVGVDATLEQARHGARVCVLRALAQLGDAVGGLDRVAQVLRMGVFVQSGPDFTQQSEVADAASDVLVQVFGAEAGRHTRTSVGVYQLPKNATVEVELTVGLRG